MSWLSVDKPNESIAFSKNPLGVYYKIAFILSSQDSGCLVTTMTSNYQHLNHINIIHNKEEEVENSHDFIPSDINNEDQKVDVND